MSSMRPASAGTPIRCPGTFRLIASPDPAAARADAMNARAQSGA